jgi:hypothetical protein
MVWPVRHWLLSSETVLQYPFHLFIYLSICLRVSCLSIYLSIYLSIVIVDLAHFFSFFIYTQSVGLLGRRSARRKAATYTQDNTNTE